ncbi:MAG: hypothetical protein MK104_03190 [Erythrobacter sp.]|nr:hypothetical protein [Erythrobacter sp.]
MTATRSVGQWLRAIADCGILRVAFGDDALVGAIELGLVDGQPVEGDEDVLDCRLTARGYFAQAEQVTAQRKAA